jgi:hypothetical protein
VKPGKSKKSAREASGESGSALASIGGKDPSLDLFHAMGKVLYSKRDDGDLVIILEANPTTSEFTTTTPALL